MRAVKFLVIGAIGLFFVGFGVPQAEAKNDVEVIVKRQKDRVMYKKRTDISFDEAVVESNLLGPQVKAYTVRRGAKFGSLIKYRRNFLPEMWKTARNL